MVDRRAEIEPCTLLGERASFEIQMKTTITHMSRQGDDNLQRYVGAGYDAARCSCYRSRSRWSAEYFQCHNITSGRSRVWIQYKYYFVCRNGTCAIQLSEDKNIRVFAKLSTFLEIYLPSAEKSKSPSHQVFGVFALEVNKILQATPSKLTREMGVCATTIYVQQQQ